VRAKLVSQRTDLVGCPAERYSGAPYYLPRSKARPARIGSKHANDGGRNSVWSLPSLAGRPRPPMPPQGRAVGRDLLLFALRAHDLLQAAGSLSGRMQRRSHRGAVPSPRAIDLYCEVVAKLTEWPPRDHSIKTPAKYLGFTWRDTNPWGTLHRVNGARLGSESSFGSCSSPRSPWRLACQRVGLACLVFRP
jgi:hypothetical protein